jgi:hypothetical protein
MQIFKTKLNPLSILFAWIKLMIIATPIYCFIPFLGATSGDNSPLTRFATIIEIAFYGAAILSILTPFFFRQWFRQNWRFVFIILLTLMPVIFDLWDRHFKNH